MGHPVNKIHNMLGNPNDNEPHLEVHEWLADLLLHQLEFDLEDGKKDAGMKSMKSKYLKI